MKRETINENEIEANSDTLTPLLDDMFKCRKKAFEEDCKEVFGMDIRVRFGSSWKRVTKREENAQKMENLEIEAMENSVDAGDEPQEGDKFQEGGNEQ